jgi:hypothetical protein
LFRKKSKIVTHWVLATNTKIQLKQKLGCKKKNMCDAELGPFSHAITVKDNNKCYQTPQTLFMFHAILRFHVSTSTAFRKNCPYAVLLKFGQRAQNLVPKTFS